MAIYYPPTSNFVQKTLGAELLSGVTAAATLNNVTSIQNKKGVMIIDRVDANGQETPSKVEVVPYTGTSGSTVVTLTRGQAGTTDQDHAVGAIVEFGPDILWAQGLIDSFTTQHNEDGTHSDITADSIDIGSTIAVTGVLDEDDMASDSAVKLATQQSIKAFVDGKIIDEDDMASDSATKVPTQQSIKAYVDSKSSTQSLYDNLLINGNMDISQRGTTFVAGANNDDVYTLDRWNLISDGNDVFDVSQEAVTDLAGSSYAIKLDVETAKRGGIIQFIEAKDAIKFRGQTVSLSFAVKSANISALRAGILSWDGTADTLTSDVVGTWGANPTPVANWTFENTPTDLTVTSSWTTVKIEGIVLDTAGMNNLGVFIWTPNEETIGDIVYISQVKVNQGATATSFMPKRINQELLDCQRYCFIPDTSEGATIIGMGIAVSTTIGRIFINTPVEMIKRPAIIATAGDWRVSDEIAVVVTVTNIVLASLQNSKSLVGIEFTVASGLTQYRPVSVRTSSAGKKFILSAEL